MKLACGMTNTANAISFVGSLLLLLLSNNTKQSKAKEVFRQGRRP